MACMGRFALRTSSSVYMQAALRRTCRSSNQKSLSNIKGGVPGPFLCRMITVILRQSRTSSRPKRDLCRAVKYLIAPHAQLTPDGFCLTYGVHAGGAGGLFSTV